MTEQDIKNKNLKSLIKKSIKKIKGKGNHKQNKKTTHTLGENICKL